MFFKKKEPPKKVKRYYLILNYNNSTTTKIYGEYRFLFKVYFWFLTKDSLKYSIRLANNQWYLVLRNKIKSVEISYE